jgi:hypothetical protein
MLLALITIIQSARNRKAPFTFFPIHFVFVPSLCIVVNLELRSFLLFANHHLLHTRRLKMASFMRWFVRRLNQPPYPIADARIQVWREARSAPYAHPEYHHCCMSPETVILPRRTND